MSEYQYVAFRAIDGPVSDDDLEFMRKQSSRAEITPWSFENEYHHGDFRGDAAAMLRRGYDFHFHYHDPDKEKVAPVPGGLNKLTSAQDSLADLYGLSEGLIAAAARQSPALPTRDNAHNEYDEWLQRQPETKKNTWLAELMTDPRSAVRRDILAEFQKAKRAPSWPTTRVDLTIARLNAAAEEIQQELDRQKAERAARQRAKKLADLAADPVRTLRKTEQLVNQRSTDSYRETAMLLADLRTALAGSEQSDLPEKHARKLKKNHPTLNKLASELRKKGFLKK
jgi:hypothetical protein